MDAPPPYSEADPLASASGSDGSGSGYSSGDSGDDGPLAVVVAVGRLTLGRFEVPRSRVVEDGARRIAGLLAGYSACASWTAAEFEYGGARARYRHPTSSRSSRDLARRAAALALVSPPAAELRVALRVVALTVDDHGGSARLAARDPAKGWAEPATRIDAGLAAVRLAARLRGRRPAAARLVFPPGAACSPPAAPVGADGLAAALAWLLSHPLAAVARWVDVDLVGGEAGDAAGDAAGEAAAGEAAGEGSSG